MICSFYDNLLDFWKNIFTSICFFVCQDNKGGFCKWMLKLPKVVCCLQVCCCGFFFWVGVFTGYQRMHDCVLVLGYGVHCVISDLHMLLHSERFCGFRVVACNEVSKVLVRPRKSLQDQCKDDWSKAYKDWFMSCSCGMYNKVIIGADGREVNLEFKGIKGEYRFCAA